MNWDVVHEELIADLAVRYVQLIFEPGDHCPLCAAGAVDHHGRPTIMAVGSARRGEWSLIAAAERDLPAVSKYLRVDLDNPTKRSAVEKVCAFLGRDWDEMVAEGLPAALAAQDAIAKILPPAVRVLMESADADDLSAAGSLWRAGDFAAAVRKMLGPPIDRSGEIRSF